MRKIYWIDLNQFDIKTDKATFWELCHELAENGDQVCLVTSYKKKKLMPPQPKFQIKYLYSPAIPLLFRIILLFRVLLLLAKVVRPDDQIIIQPAALGLTPYAHWKGAQVHLDFRTLPCDIISWKGELDRLIYWHLPLKLLLKKADSFSFITESLKREVEKVFHWKFDDYVIWTSAVNPEMFTIARNDQRQKSDPIQLFYHGHMTMKRGIPILIRAFSDVVREEKIDICLKLVGDGVELAAIKQIAEDLGMQGRIHFTGLQDYAAMPNLINQADICVSPLPDRLEWNVSSPLKVFEYLACGKPVIVTPIPAHRDVLGKMAGIVYARDDGERALADAIIEACRNIDFLRSKANDLRSFVMEEYTWRQQTRSLAEYLGSKKK